MEVRDAVAAGFYYPASATELSGQIEQLLNQAVSKPVPGRLKALIVPHAGYTYSGKIAAAGYRLLRNQGSAKGRHLLLMGPAHFMDFAGAATLHTDYWQTPLGLVRSSKLAGTIGQSGLLRQLPQAYEFEHSLELQLPFLQSVLNDFSIFPILTGEVQYGELGRLLLPYADQFDLLIASSDLSHYHSYDEATQRDAIAHRAITSLDLAKMEHEVEACGKTAILTLIYLAKELDWQSLFLDYCNSGDVTDDRERVVGYGCYAFFA